MKIIHIDGDILARSMPTVLIVFSLLYVFMHWTVDSLILVGLMMVSLIAVGILKNIIRQQRPSQTSTQRKKDPCIDNGLGFHSGIHTYGMPSGHTLVTTAFAVFALGLSYSHSNKPGKDISDFQWIYYAAATVLFIGLPIFVARQRLRIACHSKSQITVGGIIGAVLGATALQLRQSFN